MVDFEGQKLAEQIFYVIILAFGGVGWIVGYLRQDFTVVFQCWLVGVVLSVIVRKCLEGYHVSCGLSRDASGGVCPFHVTHNGRHSAFDHHVHSPTSTTPLVVRPRLAFLQQAPRQMARLSTAATATDPKIRLASSL
jgi:signal peptidase complex subunit 1